jgi:HEPN domain-containing protein
MDRKDLQSLSRWRLLEAKALLRAGLPNGAYYLAGYAVECALKACIAKSTRRYEFPDRRRVDASYTHNLKELVKLARLERGRSELTEQDPGFKKSWEVLELWSEESRYKQYTLDEATELVNAVGGRKQGVMRWIKLFW